MVFECPNDDADLRQSLLNGTVPFDGSWLIISIPIDDIGLPFARGLHHFFHWVATTPLQR
jgi:hypothetical protein